MSAEQSSWLLNRRSYCRWTGRVLVLHCQYRACQWGVPITSAFKSSQYVHTSVFSGSDTACNADHWGRWQKACRRLCRELYVQIGVSHKQEAISDSSLNQTLCRHGNVYFGFIYFLVCESAVSNLILTSLNQTAEEIAQKLTKMFQLNLIKTYFGNIFKEKWFTENKYVFFKSLSIKYSTFRKHSDGIIIFKFCCLNFSPH